MSKKDRFSERDFCEEWYSRITRRKTSGCFTISYPFAKDNPCFANSRQIAINRFPTFDQRFRLDAKFKIHYSKFMQDYLDGQIASSWIRWKNFQHLFISINIDSLLSRFSLLDKLLRIFVYYLCFVNCSTSNLFAKINHSPIFRIFTYGTC